MARGWTGSEKSTANADGERDRRGLCARGAGAQRQHDRARRHPTIGGFGGTGALGDKIDLTDLSPTASPDYAGNTTQGVLTLNDGTHHASITMLGNFIQSGCHIATDGHAGSFITYT
jgi:hypothetical protein